MSVNCVIGGARASSERCSSTLYKTLQLTDSGYPQWVCR